MAESLEDLWKLVAQSRLYSADDCRKLAAVYTKELPAEVSPAALAEWLVNRSYLSRYQAKILLAGQPGPFLFGQYMVYDRFKSGRLAGRFRARRLASKQKVCLQFLTGSTKPDPATSASLLQQADFSKGLPEQNFVRCLEYVEAGAYRFFVLDDPRCETVADRLVGQETLPPDEAIRIGRLVAQALTSLHGAGQAHGDVRPDNLWIKADGGLKLSHFALARDPLSPPPWLAGGDAWGPQIDYLAPELLPPGRVPDARSDVYSLGCALYHMLAGRLPFPAADVAQKLARRATETPPSVNEIQPAVSPALAAAIAQMMRRDPQSRPQHASDVIAMLDLDREIHVSPVPRESEDDERDLQQLPPASVTENVATVLSDSPTTPAEPVTAFTFSPPVAQAVPVVPIPSASAESGIAIAIAAAQPGTSARLRTATQRRRTNRAPLVISGAALIAMIAAGVVAFFKLNHERAADANSGPSSTARPAQTVDASANTNKAASQLTRSTATQSASPPIRALDAEMWASPTSGPPLDLRYLPPGALVMIAVRPPALLAHPEGGKTLDALGQFGDLLRNRVPAIAGIDLPAIDELLIGFLDRPPNPPVTAIVVRGKQKLSEADLLDRWGHPQPESPPSGKLFRGGQWAYFMPSADPHVLAIMSPDDAQDVVDAGEQSPLLRPEVERLVHFSDSDRLLNVLFTPDFLLMPSNPFLAGDAEQLKRPLEDVFGTDVKAGLLSCHLDGPNLFVELQISPSVDRPPMAIAKSLQDQLRAARLRIEEYIRPIAADPYAGKVLFRFPQMLTEAETHTRIGVVDRQVVMRCYLPDRAAHNLALAGELALAEPSGLAAPATSSQPQTARERLKQVTSLSFPLENLENAIATLSREINVEIKILGADLQLEGITRNQQFKDLNEVDKPADEILRQILLKARPDGKLVYVLGKDGDQEVVYITVRSKAQERGDLPPELADSPADRLQ